MRENRTSGLMSGMWKQSMGDYLRPGTRKGRNRLVCPKPLRHISTPRVGAPGQETGWLAD